jgi:hypothetical protein
MEPLRPVIDAAILRFARQHTFVADDFPISRRGVCRIHPQLVRRIVDVLPNTQDCHLPVEQLLAALV